MNISEAKQEIKNAVRAYTRRGPDGRPLMPSARQRPILLMGPPGIGKTAIMEQIASELGIGLVAYTMTHHTRQSAIGLPIIVHRSCLGHEFSATEYTMSEMIASVWEQMELTGLREGILFVDEINCVSETLMPTMLQFLQRKTFGSHRVPDGWVIVAAGNPPEHNRAARELDIVTLDRVKLIDVQADAEVWRAYALESGVHPAVLSYISLKRERFYIVRSTRRELTFVTARGWEDLSAALIAYEQIGAPAGEALFAQYLHDADTAQDFALYYELFKSYGGRFDAAALLDGTMPPDAEQACAEQLARAPFDERVAVADMISSGWGTRLSAWLSARDDARRLSDALAPLLSPMTREEIERHVDARARALAVSRDAGLARSDEIARDERVLRELRELAMRTARDQLTQQDIPSAVRAFADEIASRPTSERALAAAAGAAIERGLAFASRAFGDGPEPTFLAEDLSRGRASTEYLKAYGSEEYFRAAERLLHTRVRDRLLREIEDAEGAADPHQKMRL